MKRMLSMLLAAVLVLSCGVCAQAAEEEKGDHCHTISDIYLILNNQTVELSGLTIEMDVTGEAGSKAGFLHVDQDGETVAELGLTTTPDGLFVLHMQSGALGHKDYAIDPAEVLSRLMQGGIDSLIDLLQGVDSDSAAQDIIDRMTQAQNAPAPAQETLAPEASPRAAIPNISIQGDVVGLLLDCISEPETVHMGGLEYDPTGGTAEMPEGDYQVQTFTYDIDTICQMLDMVYVDGQPAGLGDRVRQAGVDFLFAGTFYDGDAAHIGQINGSVSGDDFMFNAGTGYNQLVTDQGSKTTFSFGFSRGVDPETMDVSGLGLTVSDGTHEGEPFTAGSVDPSGLIVLSDMDTEEALAELSQSLGLLLAETAGLVAGPIMEALMGDIDMDAMMAGLEEAGQVPAE